MQGSVLLSLVLFFQVSGQTYSEWYERINSNNTLWSQGKKQSSPPSPQAQSNSSEPSFEPSPRQFNSSANPTNGTISNRKIILRSNKTVNGSSRINRDHLSVFGHLKMIFGKYPNLTVMLVLLLIIASLILCLLFVSVQCSRILKNCSNTSRRITQLHQSSILRNPQPRPPVSDILSHHPYDPVPAGIESSESPNFHPEANPTASINIRSNSPRSFSTFLTAPTENSLENSIYENVPSSSEPFLPQIPVAPPVPPINMCIP